LELWHSTVQNSPFYTKELSALFTHWLTFFDTSVSHLEVLMAILESYLLIGHPSFWKMYGKTVANILNNLLENELNDMGLKRVLPVMETIAQLYPIEFPELFGKSLANMCKELVESSNREKKEKRKPEQVRLGYLHILARLFFQNFQVIMHMITNLSGGKPHQVLLPILKFWFDKFDDISEPYKKKLSVLALVNFLDCKDREIVQQIGNIIHCATVVLIELEGDRSSAYLPEIEKTKAMKPEERTESQRYQMLVSQDPATKINISDYLVEKMKQLSAALGPEGWGSLLSTVDPLILQQFNQHGKSATTSKSS